MEYIDISSYSKFLNNCDAFCDGVLKITETDIDKILPPILRFGGGGRAEKKQDDWKAAKKSSKYNGG